MLDKKHKKPRINKNTIMISKDEIDNLNAQELTILATIRYMFIPKYKSNKEYNFSLKDVKNIISNNSISRDLNDKLSKCLKKFSENHFISKGKNNSYIIKSSSLLISRDVLYVELTREEFETIFQFGSNKVSNSIKLCGYFINVLSTIDINKLYGYYSMDKLAEKCGIGKRTVPHYNTQLEKLNLLSIVRTKIHDDNTDNFISLNNIYYKPCNHDYVINPIMEYINEIKKIKKTKNKK